MTLLLVLSGLLGGLGFFLLGISRAGEGLQKIAGRRLRSMINSLTRNRLVALGVGCLLAFLLQSSSAATALLVTLTSATLLNLQQTIAILLGAAIGTTFTVQLIAFQITDYALLIVGVGALWMLAAQTSRQRNWARLILGLGLVFYGMKVMADVMVPLKSFPQVGIFFSLLTKHPFWTIAGAALLTSLIQASAATIGLAMALTTQGLLPFSTAILVMLGANIGTCFTGILSGLGASREAQRVGIVHLVMKIIGVALLYPFLPLFMQLIQFSSTEIPRQIANAHTLFNVLNAVVFLPLATPIALFVRKLIPDKATDQRVGPRYLDERVLMTPELAIGQATREVLHVTDLVEEMVEESLLMLKENNEDRLNSINQKEEEVDRLYHAIAHYLTRVSQQDLSPNDSVRQVRLLYTAKALEDIADIIANDLLRIARRKIEQNLSFSKSGVEEIAQMHRTVFGNFKGAIGALAADNPDLAKKILQTKSDFELLENRLRRSHIERLQRGIKESLETSAMHLDVVTSLRRINTHSAHIAQTLASNGMAEDFAPARAS